MCIHTYNKNFKTIHRKLGFNKNKMTVLKDNIYVFTVEMLTEFFTRDIT